VLTFSEGCGHVVFLSVSHFDCTVANPANESQYFIQSRNRNTTGMVVHTCNPITGKVEAGPHEFKASLSYIVGPCIQN
jgi:hypothetical protein